MNPVATRRGGTGPLIANLRNAVAVELAHAWRFARGAGWTAAVDVRFVSVADAIVTGRGNTDVVLSAHAGDAVVSIVATLCVFAGRSAFVTAVDVGLSAVLDGVEARWERTGLEKTQCGRAVGGEQAVFADIARVAGISAAVDVRFSAVADPVVAGW